MEIAVVVPTRTLHVTNIEVNGGFKHLVEEIMVAYHGGFRRGGGGNDKKKNL